MGYYQLQKHHEVALTRKAKRVLRKARLRHEFVEDSEVWSGTRSDGRAMLGNYVCLHSDFTQKEWNRFLSILPHLKKELRKTAKACGFQGGIGWFHGYPFENEDEQVIL